MRYLLALLMVMVACPVYAYFPVEAPNGVPLHDVFGRPLEFDAVYAGSLINVEKGHHEVHEGNYWICTDIDSTLASGDSTAWLVVTGNIDAHLSLTVTTTTGGIVYLVEDPTVSDSGVALPRYNMNRHYGDTTTLLWYEESLLNISGKKVLDKTLIASGSGGQRIGGASRSQIEFVLETNRKYCVVFISLANSNIVSIDAEHYEHDTHGGF